jgi:hypothetical protein
MPDQQNAPGQAADRQHGQDEGREGGGGQRLGPEDLAAAVRAGQDRLPGAVLVLAGEDVTGHETGQQREHPLGGEPEDE